MVHIIPRTGGDGLSLSVPENMISPEVQMQVKRQLQDVLQVMLGIKTEKTPASPVKKDKDAEKASIPADAQGKSAPEKGTDLDAITNMLAGGKDG